MPDAVQFISYGACGAYQNGIGTASDDVFMAGQKPFMLAGGKFYDFFPFLRHIEKAQILVSMGSLRL